MDQQDKTIKRYCFYCKKDVVDYKHFIDDGLFECVKEKEDDSNNKNVKENN